MAKISAKRIMNGTFGEVWLDGDFVGECYGCQAKLNFNKEDVPICREMGVDKKLVSYGGTGSLMLYKVNSRMAIKVGEKIKNGEDPRFTVVSKLDDPDAYGAERVVLSNVSFDDLTLADWQAATVGRVTAPFTFTDYDFLDVVEAR